MSLVDELPVKPEPVPTKWKRWSWAVLLTWLLLAMPIGYAASKLIGKTTIAVSPPHGSASRIAQETGALYFPSADNATNLFILARSDGPNFTDPDTVEAMVNYTLKIQTQLTLEGSTITDPPRLIEVDCKFCDSTPASEQGQFISDDRASTIVLVRVLGKKKSSVGNAYIEYVRDNFLDSVDTGLPDYISLYLTGEEALNLDGQNGATKDIERMEQFCVPVAFFVFAYYLQSVKLLLTPIFSIILSIACSFALCLPLAYVIDFFTITPSIMLSLAVALSIDYNLFILVRFKESSSVKEGVENVMKYTAHTILVSGSLISVAVAGLLMVPCEPIRATGVGTAVTAIATMLVNLTLTPAILCLCGEWLKKDLLPEGCWKRATDFVCCCCRRGSPSERKASSGHSVAINGDDDDWGWSPVSEHAPFMRETRISGCTQFRAAVDKPKDKSEGGVWGRIGRVIANWPKVAIVFILVIGAPFYARVPQVRSDTLDQRELLPRNAPSIEALDLMMTDFPAGHIQPYTLLVRNNSVSDDTPTPGQSVDLNATGVFSPDGFSITTEFFTRVAHLNPAFIQNGDPANTYNCFVGPMFVPYHGATLNLSYAEAVFTAEMDPSYLAFLGTSVTQPEHMLAKIRISTPFQPAGHEATMWIHQMNALIDEFSQRSEAQNLTFMLYGANTPVVDFAREVNNTLPQMIGIIVSIVAVLVLLMFRSVMIPIRLALTLVYTLAVVFGVAYYVFQTSAFHWMFRYLHNYDGDALQWMVPALSITIIIALGLDYDIYLLTRVEEIRIRERVTDKEAIIKAMGKTGSVISGAGLIMAIAFSGLVLSEVLVLNQFGVLLCTSVLLDTFVIRTVLLPAVMLIAGKWNWWPRKMPEPLADAAEADFDVIN
ncbi:putative transport protein MmpL12 [Diplonema papillatum]|nr:putative transport protein MmpL12 [Diplonema papillatum]|eukprot:gene14379-22058_t